MRRLEDYPNLRRYREALRAWPGVEETVDLFHINPKYFDSLKFINPTGTVLAGSGLNGAAVPETEIADLLVRVKS